MPPTVTTIARRPDLLPVVADWLWREWWRGKGLSLEQATSMYADCVAEVGAPQTFVMLSDQVPIGTATLARTDLDERPELTPWLAGVFVAPEFRGRGHVTHLLDAFDQACRTAAIATAWLFTLQAQRIYLRAGWHVAETVERQGKAAVTLMRRDVPRLA